MSNSGLRMVTEMILFSERGSVQGRGCHRGIHYDKQIFALCTTFMEVTDSGLPWEAEGLYIDYASLSKTYGLIIGSALHRRHKTEAKY